jgi:penicillin-binding protein 1C
MARIWNFTPKFVKLLAVTLVGLGLGWAALYFWLLADLPPIHTVEQRLVRPTTQILDRNGNLLYEVIDPDAGKQINLDLDVLPAACIQATLSTEDSRFYSHIGVDPIAILRAAWQNYQASGDMLSGDASGASTITQQLARMLLMEPGERYDQSVRRKLREAYLAWRLEFRYTKDELLALYLNQTYYGNFAFGIEAAAQIFFAKPATQLSRAECALLAGLVQYPAGYNPLQQPETAKLRQLTVLRLMHEAGYLTAAEREAVAGEPLRYRSRLFDINAPHFVIYVQDRLVQQLGPDRLHAGGLRVYTTLDLDLQRQAEAAVRHRLDLLNCRKPGVCENNTDPNRRVDNAAAVVLDSRTGEILAMVGSPDYFDPQAQGNVNAALALRQPGSAIKPLTYAAALDPQWSAVLTPATIIADLPVTFYVRDAQDDTAPASTNAGGNTPYTPVNYDRLVHGPVSVRTALANSYNIPAVKVLDRIGVKTLQQLAGQAGISTFTGQYGLALTLGGGEVRLLELTAAYGIFQDGRRRHPRAILAVEDTRSNKRVLSSGQDSISSLQSPVISPATAYLITDILSDDVARIPAFGEGSVLALPFPAAVKTGTTTDWRDNWTIGYTTERIVGVWVGNADNTPMLDVSGVDGAGPIWHDIMLAAHPRPGGARPPPFERPSDIVEVTICAPSGLLPSPACPRTRRELFIEGAQPTEMDNQFVRIDIDQASGLPAAGAPPERVAQRTFWLLPPEYHEWMAMQGIPILDCYAQSPVGSAHCAPAAAVQTAQDAGASSRQALVLTAPTSNIAYQIHPGVPLENQQIEVAGYVAQGPTWAEVRLMHNGEVLATAGPGAAPATRLRSWWMLTPGEHRFWLEGEPHAGSATVSTPPALVVVEPFTAQTMHTHN